MGCRGRPARIMAGFDGDPNLGDRRQRNRAISLRGLKIGDKSAQDRIPAGTEASDHCRHTGGEGYIFGNPAR